MLGLQRREFFHTSDGFGIRISDIKGYIVFNSITLENGDKKRSPYIEVYLYDGAIFDRFVCIPIEDLPLLKKHLR